MKRWVISIAILVTLLAVTVGGAASFGLARVLAIPDGATVAAVKKPREAVASETGSTAEPGLARPRSKAQYRDAILGRNIFDASAIGKSATPDADDGVLTDLDLRLVGTLVATPESFSSALIARKSGDGAARGYGIGDRVLDAEIQKIDYTEVTLRRSSGSIEILKLNAEDDSGSSTARVGSTASEGSDSEGIEQLSETKFVVDRGLVEKYLGDLDSVARLGRAIPHRGPDGEIDGYRLSGIRRSSVGEQLGIKNGDVIHAVNGQPLTSMQGAMAAYAALQSESGFTFEVTRRGQKTNLEYQIR